MALDTRDKRASAIHVGLPWRGLLPLPDGALNQGDRQQVAFLYRGILAGEDDAGAVPARRKRRYILPDGRRFYGTPDELRAYIAQLPPHVYATETEKAKPRRKYAAPQPLELAPDFDPPAAPYRLTPDDVSAARLRNAADRALEELSRKQARAQAEEDEAIALLLTTVI